jgi:hypothetical protein
MMTYRLTFSAFDVITSEALFAVNADCAAAVRAFIFSFLLCDECIDPVVLYELQIFEHAHAVFCAVSLVQLFQPGAAFFTFKTEFRLAICYRLTVFNTASKARRHLVCIVTAAAGAFIFLSQICHANPAVHAAWRD